MRNKVIRFINILITITCLTVLFASCTMFEKAEGSSVSFKLDSETIQKIKDAAGEAGTVNIARSAEDTAAASSIFIEVAVHGGYEKSTVVEVTNEATISIDNIPMGSEIYLEATAFIKNDGERQNLYKGHSKKFVVRESENLVMFILYRVGEGAGSEAGSSSGSGGSSGSGTGGGGSSGGSGGSGTWSAQIADFMGNPSTDSIISPDSTANVYIKLTNSASGFNYSAVSDDINCIYDAYSGKKFLGMSMGGGLATKTVSADGILFCFSNSGSEWGEDIWEASVIKGPSQSYETIASCIFTGSANSNGIVVYGNLMTSNSNPVNLAVANYAQTIDVSKLKITYENSGTETEIPQSAIVSERSEENHFYYYVITSTYSPQGSNIKVYYNNVLIKSLSVNRVYTG